MQGYMQTMYGHPRRIPHPRPYQPFFPFYTLPPIARLVPPPYDSPRIIPGTNVPMGQFPKLPVEDPVAQASVEATWPYLEPRIRAIADDAANSAVNKAAIMAAGVGLLVVLTSLWIKKG